MCGDFSHLHLFNPLITYHSMKNSLDYKNVDDGKLKAERLNGWAAMIGFWAAVGAYLTTGQIIPGFV